MERQSGLVKIKGKGRGIEHRAHRESTKKLTSEQGLTEVDELTS